MELLNRSFAQSLKLSLKTPFVLLTTQYMVLALDTWTAMISGILYLFFGGVPWVFRTQYGFSLQQTGMAFLGIGFGAIFAMCMQPYFQKCVPSLIEPDPSRGKRSEADGQKVQTGRGGQRRRPGTARGAPADG